MNVNVKYEKEAEFAFGVALVMGNDGVKVGKLIPLFEYTERTILSRVDWKRKIREEIYRVKGLVNDGDWIVSSREGRYFREDELIMLKHGLGKKMEEKLNAQGILNLGNLMDALNTPARLPPLLALKGFTLNKVTLWTGVLADSLLDGACPPALNHKIHDNPYISRYPDHPDAVLNEYGEKEWEAKMNDSPTCKKYVCIVRLIKHMFRESANIFVNNVHEHD